MLKTIAAGTIALTVAGAGLALAQSTPREARGVRPNAENVAAYTDARIAALKAGLKLTPEQEKNWPAVETAIRDLAKDRAARMTARAERRQARHEARRGGDNAQPRPDAIARLRRGAEALTTQGAALKRLADASEPLYNSLDDSQKHRFSFLLRMSGRSGAGHHRHWRRQHRADYAR